MDRGPPGRSDAGHGDHSGDTLAIADFTVDGVYGPIRPGTSVDIPGKGTLQVNPDGSYSFSPDPAFSGDVTVNYTVSGTATAGSDYTALSGSVSIPKNGTNSPLLPAS